MKKQSDTKPLSNLLDRLDKKVLDEAKKNASIEIKAFQLANENSEKSTKN